MAKSKVILDKPTPTGLVPAVVALLHRLPPSTLPVVIVAGFIGFLHLKGIDHGTTAAKHSREAWEALTKAIDEGQKAQLAEQKAYNAKVLANHERLIEATKGKP